jgi:hypothetical protein
MMNLTYIYRSISMYGSFFQTASKIFAEEGLLRGLYIPGLVATCVRELSYSSFRFGLYQPVKSTLTYIIIGPPSSPQAQAIQYNKGSEPLVLKIAAGVTSGMLGSALANPTDVVKIKLQGEAGRIDPKGLYSTGLNKGLEPTYRNTFHAFYKIAKDEGVISGLFRGVQATAIRAALLTGTQLSSYDETKYLLKKYGIMKEGPALHVVGSVVAGLVTSKLSDCSSPCKRMHNI